MQSRVILGQVVSKCVNTMVRNDSEHRKGYFVASKDISCNSVFLSSFYFLLFFLSSRKYLPNIERLDTFNGTQCY